MSLHIWTGSKEFETTHERRALSRLIREMATRFRSAPDPYALFVDFSIKGQKFDLLALTCRTMVVIDLKEVERPGGVVHGTENGPWAVRFPDGSTHEINTGRRNPFQQLDGYRYALIEWLEKEGAGIFGEQRRNQLNLRHIGAWVALVPSINEAETQARLDFIPPPAIKWFRVLGFDMLCDELYATVTPGIQLYEEDIQKIAQQLGLTERSHLDDIALQRDLELPQPYIFGKPNVPRFHLNRDEELKSLLAVAENPDYSVLVIGGPGGVGKTHLASMLCDKIAGRRQVYWVNCADHPEMTAETLLLAFANELTDRRRAQIVADRDEPEAVRMDIVLDYLEFIQACLILDDYHLLSSAGGLDRLMRRLDKTCKCAKVILIARCRPSFCQDPVVPIKGYWEIDVLGLPVEHAVAYMRHQPPNLRLLIADEDGQVIWEKTDGGFPKVMDMLARLSIGQSPAAVANRMGVFSDEQAASWFQSLLSLVGKEARRLADAASVIRGMISRDMLIALYESPQVDSFIHELEDNYVLFWDETSGRYTLNSLLREYLCGRLNLVTQRRYHDRAARHLFKEADAIQPGHRQVSVQAEGLYHAYMAETWSSILRITRPVAEQLNWLGEWHRARQVCEWALAATEKTNRQDEIAFWSLELARQLRHLNEKEQAAKQCQRGLQLAEKLTSPELCAKAYYQMGMLAIEQFKWQEAKDWHERALAVERRLGNKAHIAQLLGRLGSIARTERRFEDALSLYRESAQLSEEIGDSGALSIHYIQMGTLAKYAGNMEQGREYFTRGLENARRANRPISAAIALGQLAETSSRLGEYDHALDLIDQSLAQLRDVPSVRSYLINLGIRVDILIAANQLDQAEIAFREVERLTLDQDALGRAFNQKRRGLIAIRRGNVDAGTQVVRAALVDFETQGFRNYAQDCEQALNQALKVASGPQQMRLVFDEPA